MKKQLLAGTALVAAAALAAGGAAAQDKMKMMKPSISVNGYYEGVVGGLLDDNLDTKFTYRTVDSTDNATDADDLTAAGAALVPKKTNDKKETSALDTKTDAEIHFNGRAQLENGLKVHARVELEGQNDSNTDPVDEYFLALSSGFGQIVLGGTAGAPVKMLTGFSGSWATGVGETLNFDLGSWAGTAASGDGASHYNLQHARLDTGDAEKITYISPSLGGFQIGLTYSPNRENNDDNSRVDAETKAHDGLEGAISFSQKFGEVGIGVGAGMTSYKGADSAGSGMTCVAEPGETPMDDPTTKCTPNTNPTNDLRDWLVAARLDFGGGFRLAAAYKRVDGDDKAARGSLFDAGVRYVAGANSFSFAGSYGEVEKGEANHTSLMGSYARSLGPGVKAHVNLGWTQSQSNVTATKARYTSAGAKFDGDADTIDHIQQYEQQEQSAIVFITGISVTF